MRERGEIRCGVIDDKDDDKEIKKSDAGGNTAKLEIKEQEGNNTERVR